MRYCKPSTLPSDQQMCRDGRSVKFDILPADIQLRLSRITCLPGRESANMHNQQEDAMSRPVAQMCLQVAINEESQLLSAKALGSKVVNWSLLCTCCCSASLWVPIHNRQNAPAMVQHLSISFVWIGNGSVLACGQWLQGMAWLHERASEEGVSPQNQP